MKLRSEVLAVLSCIALISCRDNTSPNIRVPGAIRIVQGDAQTGVVGNALTQPLTVEITNAAGRAVPNLPIQFSVVTGGGSTQSAQTITDGLGRASTIWTLGPLAGAQQVNVTLAQLPVVSFHATAQADVPSSIRVTPDSMLFDAVGDTARAAATLRDRFDNDAGSAIVSWTTSDASVATVSSTGVVTSRGAGTASITAAAGSVQTIMRVRVSLTVVSLVMTPDTITLTAINDTTRLTAIGRDRRGVTIPGLALAWRGLDDAVATVDGSGKVTARSSGVARIEVSAGARADTTRVTVAQVAASARLLAGTTTPVAATLSSVGDTLRLRAEILDHNGVVITTASVTWSTSNAASATVSSTGLVTAAANGTATITATSNTASATASITVVQAAAAMAKNAGDAQSARSGATVTIAPSVIVRDANNHGMAGVTVTFAVIAGGGSITGATQVTDANGIATVGSWTLGPNAGSSNNALRATAGSLNATFSASATPGIPASITKTAGDQQTATVGTRLPVAPRVHVTDASGNPVSGIVVTFAVTSGGGSITAATPTTDASGDAQVGSWDLGTTPGSNTLQASVAGVPGVAFLATATTGRATQITKLSGDGGTQTAGTTRTIRVQVVDDLLNPVAGETISWATTSGSGTISAPTSVTAADGTASVVWTAGTGTGTMTATATAASITGVHPAFTLTSIPGPADGAHSTISVTPASITADGASTAVVTVRARDQFSNDITTGGATVVMNRTGTGTLSGVTNVGNGTYTATLTAPASAGSATITATLNSVAVPGSANVAFTAGALHHFLVEAAGGGAIGTQTASTPFSVRITAQDATGNTVTGFGGIVAVTSNRTGSSGLTTTAAFTSGVLTSHSITLTQAGPGSTITVTRSGGSETGVSNSFTVSAGVLDHFVVESSAGGAIGTQTAGSPFAVRITAQDATNNTVTSFTGTAAVTSNRTGSSGLGTSAAFTAGVLASHSVTLTQAGLSSTVTATRTAGTETGTSNAFTVGAGAVDHFTVDAAGGGAIATQTAGAPFNVRITAQDLNNNTVTSFTGTTAVSSNRTGSAGLTTSAAFTAGVLASHSVTLTQSGGGANVTATRTGGTENGTSNIFAVNPGALDHFAVEAVGGGAIGTQTAGAPFNVRITALDVIGNTVTSFTGTTDVTSNRAGSAGLTTTAAFTGGVLASHGVTLTQSGPSSTLTATRTGGTETGASNAFTVSAGALDHFTVETQGGGAVTTQTVAAPFNLLITARDANNNTVSGFTGTVDVTSNRAGSAGLATSAAFTAGVLASHAVTLTQAGPASTVTATRTGGAETGTTNAFLVNPGALDHFLVESNGGGAVGTQTAASPFSVRITAQDASNNTVTSFGGTAGVTSNRTGTVGLGTTAAFTGGVLASHSVTLTQAGPSSTLTATRTGGGETGTSNAFTVNPGALDHFAVEGAGGGAIAAQTAGGPFNVRITALDASGNTVTSFAGTTDVTSNRAGSSGLATTTAFTSGVLASHVVTLTQSGPSSSITATRTGGTENGTSNTFTVSAGALHHFAVDAAGGGPISTQTASAPFNIRVTAQDLNNNTVVSFAGTADVTSNRTGSAGLATSAAFTSGVLASHSVTLTQAGAGATIAATRTGGAEAGTSNSFTVSPGALDHFAVEAAGGGAIGTQAAGAPFNVRITALDAIGNTVTAFTGTAAVTSNRTGSAGLTTTAAFTAGVLASHGVTLTQSGPSSTLTATRTGGTEAGTSNTFTVNAGALDHFTVETQGGGAVPSQTADAAFNLLLTARDVNNNTVTGFTGTVGVTSNRTGSSGLTTSAAFTAGVLASHAVTLTQAGPSSTITITRTGGSETGTSNTFTVAPGVLHHYLVEAVGGGAIGTQTAGTPFNVRITAQDASSNTVTSFGGTAAVTSNRTGTSGLGTTAAFTAGVLASHSVTLTTPTGAGATVTATRTGGAETGTSSSFTVNSGALDHFAVEAAGGGSIATQTAASPFNVRITALDANGNTVTSFNGTTDVTSNRVGSSGLATTAAFTAGVLATHSVTLTQSGPSSSITATRTGGAENGTSNTFTVSAGLLDHFAVEAAGGGAIGTQTAATPFNVRLTAQDANNNTVTSFASTASITSNRTGSAGLATTASFTAGILASHSITLTQSGGGATITATRTSGTETGTSNAFTVNPGALDHFAVEAAGGGAIGAQTASSPFNVRITAQDSNGNTVTSYTNTVDVSSNRTGSSGLTTTAAFTAGVLASHSVTLTQSGPSSTLTATRTGGSENGTSNTFTVNPGVLHHFAVEAAGGGAIGTQAAAAPFNIRLTAQDAVGNTVTGFTGTADVTSNRTASSGLTTSAAFTAGVLASHSIALTQSGLSSTVTATRTGGSENGTSNTFTVTSGALDHFDVTAPGGGSIGTQAAATPFNVQITARDANGNVATSFTGTADVSSNRTGTSGLTTTAAFTAGVLSSHSVTLTTPTGAGARITATRTGGSETGSSNAFTLTSGALHHFLVEAAGGGPIATQTAATPFNVSITAQDVSGNTVTSYTSTVAVSSNRAGSSGLATSAAFTAGVLASHSITLTQAGPLSTVTATRTGGSENGTSNTFTVTAGALDHFDVTAAGGGSIGTQAAATPFNVQITARDANGNAATSFTGTADVSSNRTGTSGLTATAAFTAGVLSSHSVTLTTPTGAGATITATRTGGSETGTSNAFTLTAGALHHFLVETAGGGPIGAKAAGTSFNVQLTAQDVIGNTVTSFNGTADVTSNRTGTSGLTQTASFTAGVLASHSVTLTTPTGNGATVSATNHGGSETGTSNSFTLGAGALHHFLVETSGGGSIGTQTASTPFNTQFTAQDANNNTVTSFNGTVAVTSNRTGTAGLTTSASFTAGVLFSHSVTLTTPTGAGATVIVTRTGGTETGTSNAFTLNTGALHHFAIEAQGGGTIGGHASGVPFNVRFTAQDAASNTVTGYTGTVEVTSNRTASAGVNVTSAAFTAGVLASHSVTLTQSGAGATITATKSPAGPETGTSNTFTIGTPPTVTSSTPANNAVSVSPGGTITVNFSTSVNATTSSFAIECPVGSAKLYNLSASPASTYTLTPQSSLPAGQNCRVTVIAAQITDAATAAAMSANSVFSFETTPSPGIDTYPQTVIGNMSVQSANVGVPYSFTTNDVSAEAFTITSVDATSAHGGNVSSVVTSGPNMGQFVYNPPAGYHGPNDTFTYTVTTSGGSTAIGTVTMPINGMVWYIDVNAGSNGDGRMSNPFNNLASFNVINNGTGNHPAQGDNIFLYETSTPGGYVGPLTLQPHQRLIGQDASAQMQVLTTLTPPSSSVAFPVTDGGVSNGTNVTITSAGAGITTAAGDSLNGFRVGGNNGTGTVTGTAIAGTGNLYIRAVAITQGVTGAALSLSTGSADIVLDSTRVTGGTNSVSLTTMTGTVQMNKPAAPGPSALQGGTVATVSINGGTVNFRTDGPVIQTNNAPTVNIVNHATGIVAFNGTVNASAGSGLQFANADGTYNFTGVVTLGPVSQGINVNTGSSGTINITDASSAITNPSSDAITIDSSNPTFGYAGSISKSTVPRLLNMTGLSGGTTTFSGPINCTSNCGGILIANNTGGTVNFTNASKIININSSSPTAVSLTNNTGSTINFTNGGLAITTTTSNGFVASGGGTINVSGTGNSIVSTTGGKGLDVQNPTSGGALTFQSISTSGAANGIVMVNTGTGGLTVTGNPITPGRCDVGSTTCTGGFINGATGADGAVAGNGIYLSNAPNVSLTRMRVAGTVQNFGLYGNTVSGLSLNTVLLNGTFGTQIAEAAAGFDQMTGTASITNSSIFPQSGSFGDGLRILNTTGTALNRLTMTADTVGFTGTNGTNGVNILARGSNTTNVTVQNSTFRGGKNKTFVFTDSVSATSNLVFVNNLVQQGTGAYGAGALAALNIRMSGAATLTDSIAGNTFTNLANPNNAAFEFNPGLPGLGLSGSADSYIGNNTFGTSGSANSGPAHNAINIDMRGSGTARFKVADNSMYQYGDHAFRLATFGDGSLGAGHSGGKTDLTFVRNLIAQPRASAIFTAGVQLDTGVGSGDAMTACVNFGVGGQNTMNASGSTDANVPFDILSNTTGTGSFLKYLNYIGSDTGASGLAEGKLNTLIRAGIASSTFDGFLDVSQAALITSSANNASGQVCNLPSGN